VRTQDSNFARTVVLIFIVALILGLGVVAAPSAMLARNGSASGTVFAGPVKNLIHAGFAIPAVYAAANQDAGQAAPASPAAPPASSPATAVSQPKPVDLPEGDGKPIATEYCQDCHRLTNLTRAHKSAEDWQETVQTMMDRGARLPQENVDTLVKYLAKSFPPKPDATAPDGATASAASATPATAPAPAAAAPATAASVDAAASAPVQAKKVELPDGDGKAIATENCQVCHRLTNLTKAHKSLDDWRDTVQLMIDRGANVPPDQLETLIQYLARNFGPAPVGTGAGAPSAGAAPDSSAPSPEPSVAH
jgi:cytochrome c5